MRAIDILIIEDDPADVELTIRVLREHALANEIDVVRDGEEALAYFFGAGAASAGVPRLILLDLKLPKIEGLEVLRRLKSEDSTRTIPVVVLTSSREAPDLKRAYDLGVNSYLCKPIEFQDFGEVIRQLGMYWLVVNESPS